MLQAPRSVVRYQLRAGVALSMVSSCACSTSGQAPTHLCIRAAAVSGVFARLIAIALQSSDDRERFDVVPVPWAISQSLQEDQIRDGRHPYRNAADITRFRPVVEMIELDAEVREHVDGQYRVVEMEERKERQALVVQHHLARRAPGPRLDPLRETRLLDTRAQSSPRVAARSPRETVESVVERTNTPRAGAVMVSTSSP